MRGRETDGDPKRERINICLSAALLEQLEAVADADHDGSRSGAARAAISTYLDEHPPPRQPE